MQVERTLVKSPPELWAEVSDVAALARHLGELGEITITRVEHERTVAWEGELASGTVQLSPSGWGTKVVLTAEPAAEPEPEPEPQPPARRRMARLAFWRRPEPAPAPRPPLDPLLTKVLDDLGGAHRRPFSR